MPDDYDDDYDDDYAEEEAEEAAFELGRSRYISTVLSPSCCSLANAGRVVAAGPVDSDQYAGEWAWFISPHDYMYRKPGPQLAWRFRVHFCPVCGTKLPEIRRKAVPPSPLFVPDKSECYCDTCEERPPCSCYPPHAAYEVAPE